jgi:hypothetical protein
MTTRFSWLVRDLPQTLISLGAGVVGTIVVKTWWAGSISFGSTAFYLLLIMLVLLTEKTLVTIRDDIARNVETIRDDIAREVERSRITVSFHYKIATQEGDSEIYEPMIRRIAAAKKSVRVMGSCRIPTVKESEGRKAYYTKIDEILKRKIDQNADFMYERIIQVSKIPQSGTLSSEDVDRRTYLHCQNLLDKLMPESRRVVIYLKQVKAPLPPLTLIIIDEKDVIICLPWVEWKASGFETFQLGKGLFFHDREVEFSSEMRKLFDEISNHATAIDSLRDDAGYGNDAA